MSARLIQGKALAEEILNAVRAEIQSLACEGLIGLAVIQVGEDHASSIYIKNKAQASSKVGIRSEVFQLPLSTPESDLFQLVGDLNNREDIHGILIQLPIPGFDSKALLEHIAPRKDVDGFHPYNLGRLAQKSPTLRPCTPFGIMMMLEKMNIPTKGAHAVVVGASNIVGRPMALELLAADATVTICHRLTQHLESHVKQADILVVACGQPKLILGSWIKKNACVIDVGINRLTDGTLVGDVDFEEARKHAAFITPVPGGVGPMTVATLMVNTLKAYKLSTSMHGK